MKPLKKNWLGRALVVLTALLNLTILAANGQSGTSCDSYFVETFDSPPAPCAVGASASCLSDRGFAYPTGAVSTYGMPTYNSADGNTPYLSVQPVSQYQSGNWLIVKPRSKAGAVSVIYAAQLSTSYLLWSRQVRIPATYGGRFTVDVASYSNSGTQLELTISAQLPSDAIDMYFPGPSPTKCSYAPMSNIPLPTIVDRGLTFTSTQVITGIRPGVNRYIFQIPNNYIGYPQWNYGNPYFSLRAIQTVGRALVNGSPSDCCSNCSVQVSAVDAYYLDNISFRSDAPDFLETFEVPFTNCTPAMDSNGKPILTEACHSRFDGPYYGGWIDPAAPLPAYDVNDGRAIYSVREEPALDGSHWLTIRPPSIAGKSRGSAADVTADIVMWGKQFTVPSNIGGRFTVDVPHATSTQLKLQYTGPNDAVGVNAGLTPTVQANVASGVDRLVYDIPDANPNGSGKQWPTGELSLSLRVTQTIPGCAPSSSCDVMVTAPFYCKFDNISFRSNGPPGNLALPVVADKRLCAPGPVTLTVTNLTSGASYAWYTSPSATTPFALGSSITPTVTVSTIFYVQATPAGAIACPSGFQPVTVVVQPIAAPTLTLPGSIVLGNTLDISFSGSALYTYSWDWGDQTAPLTQGTTVSHQYDSIKDGGYDIWLTVTDSKAYAPCELRIPYHVEVIDKLCELVLSAADIQHVTVSLNRRNGVFLIGGQNACLPTSTAFDCLTGEAESGGEVVAASAISLTDQLVLADPTYTGATAAELRTNPYLVGAGHLRPEASYAYATDVASTLTSRNFEVGYFTVTPFTWQIGSRHRLPAWQRAGLATRFSPNGEAVEEKDILDVFSTVKLGYAARSLPYLTAKNAGFSQVLFESFENMNASSLQGDDRFVLNSTEATLQTNLAHSGGQCLKLTGASGNFRLSLPQFTTRAFNQGMQCKVWLRASRTGSLTATGQAPPALSKATLLAPAGGNTPALTMHWAAGQDTPLNIVAQSGDWMLCEATLPTYSAGVGPSPASYTPQITATNFGTMNLWVDDIRLQPLTAQMTCYVYDPQTLKLVASFDDQHFGLYYQYNPEGKLVRKQVETERGLRTIQETQYNTLPNN